MPAILPIRGRQETPPANRFPFTTTRLERFQCPSGRVWLTDAKCPDLRLQVTAAGAKSFYVYRKLHGEPIRYRLGSFSELGIDAARKMAREKVGVMVKGIDPREAKRAARDGVTFAELATSYIDLHAKPRKKSWQEDQRQLDTYLKPWYSRALQSIRREHVAALHAKLGKDHGHYVANRALALLSSIFEFAGRERGWNGGNPCKGVRRFKEEKRTRFLQPNELPAFFKAVEAEPSQGIRDYIYVSLFTGARRSNVLAMRWADIDLDAAVWTIPDTKSGKPVTLPLVPEVVAILKSRPRVSEYVFPGRHGHGHLKDPMRAWRSILQRAGLTNLRLHDLRRTFGSWQAAAGVSLPIIGKSLGHTSLAATEVYSRLHLDPVRVAVTAATTAIIEAAKKDEVRK